jgi:hypothetical protein
MDGSVYLSDAIRRFREAQGQCERALSQVPFERWNQRLDPDANIPISSAEHLARLQG